MPLVAAPAAYLACADAREALDCVAPGTVRAWVGSPPFGNLLDYRRAAQAVRAGADMGDWRSAPEGHAVTEYLAEHAAIVAGVERALAADAIVALEVDHVRDPNARALVLYADLWAQMLEAAGLRIIERITLVRTLAIGRRSGHFKRHPIAPGMGAPGYALLDNVTSTLLVAAKGDPLARLRREARPEDGIEMRWAERFLRNAWTIRPPRRRTTDRRRGHPVPMDRDVLRALLRLYTLRGDRVLDCYAGEGTAGVVAVEEGRLPLLIEREPEFAGLARDALLGAGVPAQPLAAAPRPHGRVVLPSAQLALPLDFTIHAVARRAFLRGAVDDVTARHRDIARRMRQEFGIEFSPEMVGLFLRAERAHYADTKRQRAA